MKELIAMGESGMMRKAQVERLKNAHVEVRRTYTRGSKVEHARAWAVLEAAERNATAAERKEAIQAYAKDLFDGKAD
ncbi:hypothetical protein AB0C27_30965 [Nonomuraea sp. NPDC048882]|uniref:hypothetical protein n=1 Tax=Nonomuraea sp. NPDC048882 TaxID=3154347 RepID=UPI0033FA937B